ncbi:MAG: hypothetical protein AVDCRST_MAG71-2103, partial [uncultured Lysobacter sp.]
EPSHFHCRAPQPGPAGPAQAPAGRGTHPAGNGHRHQAAAR